MTLDGLRTLCELSEQAGKAQFNLTLPRTSHKRMVRIAEGLYGLRVGLTVSDDTVVLLECRDVRKWIARVERKEGEKLKAEFARTMDRGSKGGNT